MIKRGKEIGLDKVRDFIIEKCKDFDEYDDTYYTLNYLLKEENSITSIYALLNQNGEIYDLIYSGEMYGLVVLSPYFISGYDMRETVLREIKSCFSGVVVETSWIDVKKLGFHYCNLKCSFDERHEYHVDGGCSHSVCDISDVNILRDAIETTYFPNIDIENVTFELWSGKDVHKNLMDKEIHSCYPMWNNENNHSSIVGFHYLCPDFHDCHSLLVAKCNGVMIGAIKYGRYDMDTNYKHYGLNFIDVNKKYRNRGIAKILIEEFAKILDDDMPLVLSSESDMGKKCHMADTFKAANFKTKVFAYGEKWY